MKKILIIPPTPWYMQSNFEYLIRYLSDEFFIEQAFIPYPPYDNFLDRYPETSPLMRNPNDYDLLLPIWSQHWGVAVNEENGKKVAVVMYEPGEGAWHAAKLLGMATPAVEAAKYPGKKTMSVRFGIDAELFRPMPMVREDDLLHVGVVGSHGNPRRMIAEAVRPLFNMAGVRVMIFPSTWVNNGGHADSINSLGGKDFVSRCVAGEKPLSGIPNLYNRLDVLLRIDSAYGYSFPTLEAAACGVPVIATNQGIDHHITEAGGGILIGKDKLPQHYMSKPEELAAEVKKAVIYLRDHPRVRAKMGKAGRAEILKNWMWHSHIPAWRKFLREATSGQ